MATCVLTREMTEIVHVSHYKANIAAEFLHPQFEYPEGNVLVLYERFKKTGVGPDNCDVIITLVM